jgi:3-oxoadipate enol-lactonase
MILHVDQHGEGDETVVLLHSLALDASVWQRVIPELSDRARVLAVDLRGHGRSGASTDFTVEDMADDVVETLGSLGVARATVVGLSLGGCVAQAVAFRHPEVVAHLVLADTTAWYGEDATQAWAERAERARREGLDALAGFQLDRWFSAGFREGEADLCARLLAVFCANDLDSYTATCAALGGYDGRGRVEGITVPTEIVVGEHDGATPVADADDLGRRVPNARVTVVPEAKHLTALERPDAIIAAVERVRRFR